MELSERQTPETEAAIIDELDVELVATGSGRWKGDTKMQLVPADFARKLERERDEAREQLRICGQHMIQVSEELDAGEGEIALDAAVRAMGLLRRAEQERDEALKQVASFAAEREHNAMQALAYKAERDEAREQIKGWELKWKCAVEMAALAQNKAEKVWEAAK